MWSWLTDFLVRPWREQQASQAAFVRSDQADRVDWEVILVLLSTSLVLTLQYYGFSEGDFLLDWFPIPPDDVTLSHRAHWAIGQSVLYILLPVIVIRLVLRRRIRDYGLKFRGMGSSLLIYLGMYLCVLPWILILCDTPSFQHTYPFYKPREDQAFWPRMMLWETLYAIQFFTLEFFFRGFLVHGLKRRFGMYSIFVMTVPYCMIHFGKPLPETLAAIIAGVVLGFMSLKTNSIWLGAALHIAVAWSMDAAALFWAK
jgi:membrane protease YdiL (CAAX protease family)